MSSANFIFQQEGPHFLMSDYQEARRIKPNQGKPAASLDANERTLQQLRTLSKLLDSKYAIPGTSVRFGLDSIIGLVPGIGDGATALVGLWMVNRARSLGISRKTQAKMVGNLALDFAIGLTPAIGDIGDVLFKAHLRNLRMVEKELGVQITQPKS
jgi:hypothetical protein